MRIILNLFVFLFALVGLYGDESSDGSTLIFGAHEIHQGDYFVAGNHVEISGTVVGDLYVAGSQVFIDGIIHGDVLLAAGCAEVGGQVMGNIRALGGQITVTSQIGKSATIVAGNSDFMGNSTIGGNAVCIAGNVDFASALKGNLTAIASNLRLSNYIGRSVVASVAQMRLTSKAQIVGNVDYTSRTKASIDPGARVDGQILQHISAMHDLVRGKWMHGLLIGSKVAAALMNFFYSLAVGIIFIKLFPHQLSAALHSISRHFWKTLLFGLVLLVLLPLASLVMLMTILGVPFALTLLALNVIGFYTAKVFAVLWVANRYGPRIGLKENSVLSLFLGMLAYFLLIEIPFIGLWIAFFAMILGLGAGVVAQLRRTTRPA